MDSANLNKNRNPALPALVNTATSSKITSAATSLGMQKTVKPPTPSSPAAPRLEVRQYHEALKSALTKENWVIYSEALNKFLTGRLSDGELIEEIGTFIKGPNIRLHNILLSALISNTARDSPPTEVALWVTDGDDASSSATKPPGGDVTERKLKMEVMGISARERKRLKEVPEKLENVEDIIGNMLQDYHMAKQVRSPEPDTKSASLSQNWETEIKQRYTLPLSCESGEFPDVDSVRLRLLPICYEEGVPGGCSPDTANFMIVATETFVKEVLSQIITRVRSNGPKYVPMDRYRKLAPKGRWTPPERPLLGMFDVRLSLELGDNFLNNMPNIRKKILCSGWFVRDYEVDPGLQFEDLTDVGSWEGGEPEDRKELKGLLDDCLA